MLFGATESSAKTNEAEEPVEGTQQAAGGQNFTVLLLLMLLAGGTLYYFMKVRRIPAPLFSGMSRRSVEDGSLLAPAMPASLGTAATGDPQVTSADKAAFQQLLVDVQTAWGKQDLVGLRRVVTPEMLTYFSAALAEQTSQDLENRVEDVVLVEADVQESWTEDSIQYVTARLCWTARDYTVSLTKKRGEPGYVVEGSEATPVQTTEVWTFMRHRNGKWLLSAIQQPA